MTRISEADLSHAALRQTVHGNWYIAANDGSGLEWGYFDSQGAALTFVGKYARRMSALSVELRRLGLSVASATPEKAR